MKFVRWPLISNFSTDIHSTRLDNRVKKFVVDSPSLGFFYRRIRPYDRVEGVERDSGRLKASLVRRRPLGKRKQKRKKKEKKTT